MSKAPAFQLYASDFYMDTNHWTIEEIGIYQRLLLTQWVNGSVPVDEPRLARIAGCGLRKFQKWWPTIKVKFHLNGNGELKNLKLEEVRNNQLKYSESRRKNVSTRYKDKPTHEGTHEEDMNLSSSSSSSSNNKEKKYIKKRKLSDEEWTEEIKKLNPWIDWEQLNREMDTWLLNNPTRQKTRRFISNWILRKQKDKPMSIVKPISYKQDRDPIPELRGAIEKGWK